ncbi:MAG: Txe/YoeB family addiction module toxin [Synergistaceae bacterium]|nr:Txe/YoeB family addiction module toxin [Synergistaceae bacterium]
MRGIFWMAQAWDDYVEFQSEKQILRRINMLLKDIQRNGHNSLYGKPEKLKHDLSGMSSVRIDKKNRLVFKVDDEKVTIVECGIHYQKH